VTYQWERSDGSTGAGATVSVPAGGGSVPISSDSVTPTSNNFTDTLHVTSPSPGGQSVTLVNCHGGGGQG